ncbi:hypothetical protein OEA41_010130 [Lepraria neglecta]|uniref:Uncharacterized protein n=1 Tax=Lepraria neglecta TaxID=209136 RepID=A0AAE0DF98_9LECA|nr:hypothetical protein OEA41_010130 [Lepraria neglecta]
MDPVVQIDPAHMQLTQTLRAAQSDKFKVSSMFLRFRGGDYWLKILEGGFKEGENNLKTIVSGD